MIYKKNGRMHNRYVHFFCYFCYNRTMDFHTQNIV